MCGTQRVLTLVTLFVGLAHSWDIALSKGELLEFYINATKTTTVRFENQNLAALAFDEVHNMILYVDKQSHGDAICGYDISSMENRCFTERNGRNIQGLAFDPATELCFFSDTNERSINWFSLKPGSKNKVNGNVLIKMNGIPTDIAVDSCRGYIYWINAGISTPTIERSRFNGYEREVVIYSTSLSINSTYKLEPYSLAIDQQTKKIFWIEPETRLLYRLYSTDLNGKNKEKEVWYKPGGTENFSERPNSLTILKKSVFMVGPCAEGDAWEFPRSDLEVDDIIFQPLFALNNEVPVGIAGNYKISEQIQGIQECNKLTGLVRNLQCDVSVYDSYCIQGKFSLNQEGLPECRCNAGYSGKRCEVYACHGYCLNNGYCLLNEAEEPVCQCVGNHEGSRCEAVAKRW